MGGGVSRETSCHRLLDRFSFESLEDKREPLVNRDLSPDLSFKSSRSSAASRLSFATTASNVSNFFDDRHVQSFQENRVRCEVSDIREIYDFSRLNIESLGNGMSSTVLKVRRLKDDKLFAVKCLKISNMKEKQQNDLRREISVLKTMDHPNIAKLYECYEALEEDMHLVLELGDGGELYTRLMKVQRFDEKTAAHLMKQILGAVGYIHDKGIIHRDLKLENWVFRNQHSNELMLIDFGLCQKADQVPKRLQRVGTSYYMAPEALKGKYSYACDIWSSGILLFMLLSGRAPFGGQNDAEIIYNVEHEEYSFDEFVWKNISHLGKQMVSSLLRRKPKCRPSAEKALEHTWIINHTSISKQPTIPLKLFRNIVKFSCLPNLKQIIIRIMAYSVHYADHEPIFNLFADIDTQRKGSLSIEEFREAVPSKTKVSDAQFAEIVSCLDPMNTGAIGSTDFLAATLDPEFYVNEENLQSAFDSIDCDRKGYITLNEIDEFIGSEEGYMKIRKSIVLAFEDLERGDDLTFENLIEYMQSDL